MRKNKNEIQLLNNVDKVILNETTKYTYKIYNIYNFLRSKMYIYNV